jgi:hypothetical protein
MTHHLHTRTHGFIARATLALGTTHMIDEVANAVAHFGHTPMVAAAQIVAAILTHRVSH